MAEFKKTKPFTPNEWNDGQAAFKYATELKKKYEGDGYTGVKVTYKQLTSSTAKITNPIKDAGPKDACRINSKPRQFYLRFGYLLKYIKENVLPRIKIGDDHNSNPQIFNIDINEWSTYMYSLPNQISLDPRVCIVGNRNFYAGNPNKNTQVYPELPIFREIDNGESDNPNSAYPLNIFLNFEFILECLKPDDRGDVNLFEFIASICTGLNKALGGINNLEPIIDESTNTLSIVDTTPIPGHSDKSTTDYTLQLYGYNKNGDNYISNFVRNVDLKTAITPEFATMITVGATAGGYVKGTEATAFSKWNVGLKDRFKEKFTPGNINSVSPDDNEAETNYVNEFISGGYITRYGFTGLSGNFTLNTDAIERNLSVVTEYYKYLIAKEAADNDTSGGTIGFIPFKLSFTLDGISGFKIYNKLEVNTEFLPKVYGTKSSFIITGVSHNLTGNDWTTQVETTLIPKHGKKSTARIDITSIQESVATVKKSKGKVTSKNPDKLCGLASANNVDTVYPRSVRWRGTAAVIVNATNKPNANISLGTQPEVSYQKTIVTAEEYVKAAEKVIDTLAPNASKANKKKVLVAAFAISKAEQGYQSGFKGFNNNIAGIESSGFSVFNKTDVVGKVKLTEGGTGKKKFYYAFKSIDAGLTPLISKIMDRNMFATGGQPNEFAWRYFRDWNGYGARTKDKYSTDPNWDDCDIIATFESSYKSALSAVNTYSKYK